MPNVATTSGNWMDHSRNVALLSSHHLPYLLRWWLKLLELVLTWRYCRHEGALCYRSLDLKEATAIARYTAVQNGTQGMYHFRIVLWSFVTVNPCPISFKIPRSCHRPSAFEPLPLESRTTICREAGKRPHAGLLARYTRQTPSICVTQPCLCLPTRLAFHSAFFASLALFSDVY
jgi:hypothetical protein